MKPTPNLFVIGAMKAGTTSFHHILDQHPLINMSSNKEPEYFKEENYETKKYEDYLNLFSYNEKIIYYGESSVSYSKCHHKSFKGIPERILKTVGGDIKIIYLLRDPINRTVSHFIDSKNYGDIKPNTDINTFFSKKEEFKKLNQVVTSQYSLQLREFLKFFNQENILLLEYEEIFRNPEKIKKSLSEFLGVDFKDFEVPNLNVTSQKKYYSGLGYHFLLKENFRNKLKFIIPLKFYNKVRDSKFAKKMLFQDSNQKNDELDKATRELLKKYFRDEVRTLKSEFGFSPTNWENYSE